MSALEFGKPQRQFRPLFSLTSLIALIALLGVGFFLAPRFEWTKPQI